MDGLAFWQSLQQALHEVVVRIGFIDKAPTKTRDRNQAGLAAFNQMRKVHHTVIGSWHQRNGRHGGRMFQVGGNHRPNGLTHTHSVTGIASGRRRKVLRACWVMRK